MEKTTQLSREDVMFIAGENETTYQHVAGLVILDTSDAPGFDYDHFRGHCEARASLVPHFRWKVHTVPLGLDRPYWVEDEHFSFDHHIKRIALPRPGTMDSLCEVAANLYASHLDRSKPLWEIWLIEGLEGDRFAFLLKFHHSMMDGEGALRMIDILCDFEPSPKGKKLVDESISSARAGQVPTAQQRSSKVLQHLARLPGEATRSAVDLMRPIILEQFVWSKPKKKKPEVPITMINGEISSQRAITVAALPMDDLMKVKKHFEVSLNDLILALVSSSVREYLATHDSVPREAMRTNIPVSLRSADDEGFSNKVTNTTVTLATNEKDPVKRLRLINKESQEAKSRARDEQTGVIEIFQMMPPILISTLMESVPAEQLPQVLGANLIISNIRGSPIPLYMAGARMEKMYPVSILTAGIGINFTCISYMDYLDFGITVDPDRVPDFQLLSQGLQQSLDEYLGLCSARRRKTPAKRKTTAKRKVAAHSKAKGKAKAKSKAGAKTKAEIKAKANARRKPRTRRRKQR
jgi:WS/DGAT/MGAT family acyltransferase